MFYASHCVRRLLEGACQTGRGDIVIGGLDMAKKNDRKIVVITLADNECPEEYSYDYYVYADSVTPQKLKKLWEIAKKYEDFEEMEDYIESHFEKISVEEKFKIEF